MESLITILCPHLSDSSLILRRTQRNGRGFGVGEEYDLGRNFRPYTDTETTNLCVLLEQEGVKIEDRLHREVLKG